VIASPDGPHIGRRRRRVEDPRLLTGRGRYVDDIQLAGCLHLVFLRSPHAHARIGKLDVEPARRAPGVVTVVTGAAVRGLGAMPVNRLLPDMRVPPDPIMPDGVVQAVGLPVAAVAAETPAEAWDALERIQVEWEPLPALAAPEAAIETGAPPIHPELGSNLAFARTLRRGDPESAFARAARVVELRIAQQRLHGAPLEPRGIVAAFDAAAGELTVWTSTQAPFRVRTEIARALGLPEARVRVVAPDVGGGFGLKTAPGREEILTAWCARRLGRPVRWIATRTEDFLTTAHGRGGVCQAALALDGDGRIRAIRGRIVCPLGGVLAYNAAGPPWNHARLLPGAYAIEHCHIELVGALTTTAPVGAYRGAGRPEATFAIERLVDEAARALGLDPAEIRRRNFVPPEGFPFTTVTGQTYDSGDYARALDHALELAGYPALRREQGRARARGELVGVGLATYVEPCGLGWESGSVRVERSGTVTAITGSSAQGQGHATTFAQIVADHLGVDPDAVTLLQGDTRTGPVGFGTFGSRSTVLGGGALVQAAREVRDKGRRIAAAILEAAPEDVVAAPGGFQVTGVPERRIAWARVAEAAYGPRPPVPGEPPGLEATAYFRPEGEVWSFGAVVAGVRVERETGRVALERLVWVDDAGTIVNPLLAEGQLQGGLAQGLGQALLEAVCYDEWGQLLTGTFMDYALPRADEVPVPLLAKTVTPSPRNPLGAKGLGEAGCIAIPPAVVNAVVDALAPSGVRHLDMPLTPERVWQAIRAAR
jgi:aerobic carbon-monoxide dehydrogenase large subunit